MTGTGDPMSGVPYVKADPVSFYACPRCDFPLNVYFLEYTYKAKKINVHVACSRCMWSENWSELKITEEEENKDAARSGT